MSWQFHQLASKGILTCCYLLHLALCNQAGEVNAAEELMNLITQVRPQLVSQANLAMLAIRSPVTFGGINILIHRVDDLRNINIAGSPAQAITTTRTSNACHQLIAP